MADTSENKENVSTALNELNASDHEEADSRMFSHIGYAMETNEPERIIVDSEDI